MGELAESNIRTYPMRGDIASPVIRYWKLPNTGLYGIPGYWQNQNETSEINKLP